MKKLTEERLIKLMNEKFYPSGEHTCNADMAVTIDILVQAINEAQESEPAEYLGEGSHFQFLGLLRAEFQTAMNAKTGWGKNEVMSAFEAAVSRALLELTK